MENKVLESCVKKKSREQRRAKEYDTEFWKIFQLHVQCRTKMKTNTYFS
jgi:hypothetical protein